MGGVHGAKDDAGDAVFEGTPRKLLTHLIPRCSVAGWVALHASRKGGCEGDT